MGALLIDNLVVLPSHPSESPEKHVRVITRLTAWLVARWPGPDSGDDWRDLEGPDLSAAAEDIPTFAAMSRAEQSWVWAAAFTVFGEWDAEGEIARLTRDWIADGMTL